MRPKGPATSPGTATSRTSNFVVLPAAKSSLKVCGTYPQLYTPTVCWPGEMFGTFNVPSQLPSPMCWPSMKISDSTGRTLTKSFAVDLSALAGPAETDMSNAIRLNQNPI